MFSTQKIMKVLISLFVLLLLQAPPVYAQKNHPIDSAMNGCLSRVSTTLSMINCVQVAQRSWDKELDIVFKQLIKKLAPKARQSLYKSQNSWLQYREAESQLIQTMYQHPRFSGTLFLPIKEQDIMKMTKQRVQELKERLAMHSLM